MASHNNAGMAFTFIKTVILKYHQHCVCSVHGCIRTINKFDARKIDLFCEKWEEEILQVKNEEKETE